MLRDLIQAVDGAPDYDRHGLTQRAREFTTHLGEQTGHLEALELARLVQEIVHHGDAAAHACKGILGDLVVLLRSPRPAGRLGGS